MIGVVRRRLAGLRCPQCGALQSLASTWRYIRGEMNRKSWLKQVLPAQDQHLQPCRRCRAPLRYGARVPSFVYAHYHMLVFLTYAFGLMVVSPEIDGLGGLIFVIWGMPLFYVLFVSPLVTRLVIWVETA